MSNTIEIIKKFDPYNKQEEKDKQFFIDCESVEQILTRENERCHLTCSAFIINKSRDKVLCIYHNIYQSWCWVGGHVDGDDDPLYVIKKEISEETSLGNVTLLCEEPVSIESLPVAAHVKRGKFVSAHTHLNVTYLFESDESETVTIKEDENSNIGWLTFDELITKSTEPHMKPAYKKIIEKIERFKF